MIDPNLNTSILVYHRYNISFSIENSVCNYNFIYNNNDYIIVNK